MKKYKKKITTKTLNIKTILHSLPIVSTLLIISSIILIVSLLKSDINLIEPVNTKPDLKPNYTHEEFIDNVNVHAQKNYKKYNILPSVTISQAILESDWGKSELSSKYHNYFGIKSISEKENRIVFKTTEYINGKPVTIEDAFRVFKNLEDSVRYHGLLLGTANIYKRVVNSKNYKEATSMLYKCGYATDPNYTNLLNEIIEQYELYKYDVK